MRLAHGTLDRETLQKRSCLTPVRPIRGILIQCLVSSESCFSYGWSDCRQQAPIRLAMTWESGTEPHVSHVTLTRRVIERRRTGNVLCSRFTTAASSVASLCPARNATQDASCVKRKQFAQRHCGLCTLSLVFQHWAKEYTRKKESNDTKKRFPRQSKPLC